MDRIDKNGRTIFMFIIILIIIIAGGIYLIKNNTKRNIDDYTFINNNEKKIIDKIDNDKEYIYFTNEEIIDEEEELSFKDIVFNFKSDDTKKIEKELNDRMNEYRKSIEKENDQVIDMKSIDYEIILSKKYVSLIARDYKFTNKEEKDNIDNNYYVFDLYTGKLLDNKTIMKKEGISESKIKELIKDYIKDDDNIESSDEYNLTIGKNGKVILNFVVNSNDINYNVSKEIK